MLAVFSGVTGVLVSGPSTIDRTLEYDTTKGAEMFLFIPSMDAVLYGHVRHARPTIVCSVQPSQPAAVGLISAGKTASHNSLGHLCCAGGCRVVLRARVGVAR